MPPPSHLPVVLGLVAASAMSSHAQEARSSNQLAGTWQLVEATIDPDGQRLPAYGPRPGGLLVFTDDMHFVEVLTDTTVPRFKSDVRGEGSASENAAAMKRNIGFFGTYTVDADGGFSGNRVDGSTFPNWVGDVRTTSRLRLDVQGDRMTENFQRPDGTRIAITWQRRR